MCGGFKCNGLIVFSQIGGNSKSLQHICFPPTPPPPPLPGSPPPPAPPQLRCCWLKQSLALVLWQGCSPRWRVIRQLWQAECHIWWIRAVGESCQSARVGRWPAATPPPPPAPLVSLIQGHGDRGGRGGGWQSFACTWSYIRSISARELENTQDLLDVTWTVSSFVLICWRDFNEEK